MNKLVTALGCLMMLGMTIAPVAFAHGDSGFRPQGVAVVPNNTLATITPPGWRGTEMNAGNVGSLPTTPAGFYFGSASAWLQLNSGAIAANTVPGCPSPTGGADPDVDALLCGGIDPSFTAAVAFGLCDMEVLGDGSVEMPPDETIVDGTTGGTLPFIGLLNDGVFNDGGIGAVCHTPASYYSLARYNTPGCDPTRTATARDFAFGYNGWVSATCDSAQPGTTTPLLTRILSLETCTVNSVLQGAPGQAAACVTQFAACVVGPPLTGCPGTGSGPSLCIPDGVADTSASAVSTPAGVAYPGSIPGCSGDSSQAAFIWNSVQVTVPVTGTPPLPGVPVVNQASVGTSGWVK